MRSVPRDACRLGQHGGSAREAGPERRAWTTGDRRERAARKYNGVTETAHVTYSDPLSVQFNIFTTCFIREPQTQSEP